MTEIHPDDRYDVIVIGAGPGGYVAAGRAGRLGLKTALVEKAELGGICLNWGCIPTKALLHGAEVARTIRSAAQFGVLTDAAPAIDVAKLVAHSRSTSGQLTSGVGALMGAAGVTVIAGEATIADKGQVSVTLNPGADGAAVGGGKPRLLGADHIIVATGAGPRGLPGIEPDGQTIWTYRQALVPDHVPESLVVIGSGAIGSEFASLYADLGSQVTLLEALPHVLPGESAEASDVVAKNFRSRGITAAAGVRVGSVEVADVAADGTTSAVVHYTDAAGTEQQVSAEKVLLAVGVAPNSAGLGLEPFGIVDGRGFIETDEYCRTKVWGLYAIGDVSGGPMLAHKASAEALRCVDALAGFDREPVDADWRSWVPRCTYTTPEVASIGLSREQAGAAGHPVVARPVRLAENGRALGTGQTEGFGEVLIDGDTHEILGATLVGEGMTELIGMLAVSHAGDMSADAFVRAILPHPSKSEVVHESLMAALGRPVNTL
ncbi:dihydrolipoyl dehydrogenase [Brevibacterium sp. 50QC2O2]|uniref:dihydrolipoyl dehydrogenase n=1 Tax=Brevibacterium TaxID=1696 RepID=UPI00211C326C|nr:MULTISPECIES: dihydrolipoyl dehydrogenase [unclassified Brevibacterium]MCQ9369523.1 dihydrolipoyl dehydrogenase [Brevibacterium sp. 91QC2O2]MCQ9385716.1 dihydrolipoyl dehydrogenase [Brevibacterium sp. 68QC2CO]MCQ9389857.1 dihydrolipoyl dehydrogenase [Brevibacterium sp. 50QC2O2]